MKKIFSLLFIAIFALTFNNQPLLGSNEEKQETQTTEEQIEEVNLDIEKAQKLLENIQKALNETLEETENTQE